MYFLLLSQRHRIHFTKAIYYHIDFGFPTTMWNNDCCDLSVVHGVRHRGGLRHAVRAGGSVDPGAVLPHHPGVFARLPRQSRQQLLQQLRAGRWHRLVTLISLTCLTSVRSTSEKH
jgi:hypothetical protein